MKRSGGFIHADVLIVSTLFVTSIIISYLIMTVMTAEKKSVAPIQINSISSTKNYSLTSKTPQFGENIYPTTSLIDEKPTTTIPILQQNTQTTTLTQTATSSSLTNNTSVITSTSQQNLSTTVLTGDCPILIKSSGNINFLAVPNRNISQNDINNGTFTNLILELFFGKSDAYYFAKNNPELGGLYSKPAPGFFDITPLNEYKNLVNIYYYNATTTLDCEYGSPPVGKEPSQKCFKDYKPIRDFCAQKIGKKIDRVIVIDTVGWDFAGGIGEGSMWFDNVFTSNYSYGTSSTIPVFDAGRVAAHEFGHTLGFNHVNLAPLQEALGIIEPVDDVFSYSESLKNITQVPVNCDTFSSTKWCNGVDLNTPCLKDFENFLHDVKNQCGNNPTLTCERDVWSADLAKLGHQPLDPSCNIGINCKNNSGSYTNYCGDSAFFTSSGNSVMGSDHFSFSPYESELVREAMNEMNNK